MKSLAKKNLICRAIIRNLFYTHQTIKYKTIAPFSKIDDKLVVFACFGGKSYTCSPKALYEYMLTDEKYKDYKFVWAFKKVSNYEFLNQNRNTTVVRINSKKYKKAVKTAKYWIFNYKIPEYLKPKKDQVFLQCWHGTPLKRLGCDLIHFDNVLNTIEGMKKRYRLEAKKFTYFISPSKYCTEKFTSAWDLKSIGKENIMIEEGYPRNDFLFKYTENDVIDIKKRFLGEEYVEKEKTSKKKKIILYAPTYRSNQHETGTGYVYKEEVDFERLRKLFGEEYIILFRPHYFVANSFDFEKYSGFVYNVSDIDDINELYVISDILITDYSSVFFDYANLKRPIIFYMYDLEHYRDKSNGFYFDVEKELPGKIVKTEDDLIEEIKRVSNNFEYDKKYQDFNNKFNYLDDAYSSKRVLEKVIDI